MIDYDVIVVGGGPIGSTYAYNMAKQGYNVGLFEIKNRVGEPLQCAGLVSTNIDQTENLPEDYIYNYIYGANLFSPNNTSIRVNKSKPVAYALDRVLYDKYLIDRAIDAGVDVHFSSNVSNIDTTNTTIKVGRDTYSSKIIAVAQGPGSPIARKMNPELHDESYLGVQYTLNVPLQDIRFVDVKVDTRILPGFIWRIPVSPTKTRLGLFTDLSFQEANQILSSYICSDETILEKHYGTIPKYSKDKRIVENNTILLGDSASQIKPTTGGGLIVGFNCCMIAAKHSMKMLIDGDNNHLLDYEKEYHKKYDSEFKTQQNVIKILTELTEDDYDYMFEQLIKYDVNKIISRYGDMDSQTELIKELIKSGIIFKLVPTIGVRRLKNLWKSQ
ncbi:MAG: NAD(P)/FAD-dependent oxidoreductase [Methanosphaera sp.]|nr:NAD(P)/FAD-dependent oxidoreductase [Methanosphaera sp.]